MTSENNTQNPGQHNDVGALSYRRRAGAFLLDLVVGLVPLWLLLPLIVALYSQPGASDQLAASALLIISPLPCMLLYLGIQLIQLGRGKQTPGRRLARVEVVRSDGSATTVTDALRREVVGVFLPLSILAVTGLLPLALLLVITSLIDAEKRSFPDMIAGTKVVPETGDKRGRQLPWEPPLP